ncbi:hypothetical protein G9G63_10160 [Paenibacillus sp. EKM202P]|uniref:hypothetical protein n=1 Tax=unclassified Paenibacillus TaxID=185978 RepID=UPI0013E9AC83|nr:MULTISPECIES: hypothetical protein [unclassified Paenibacillus]KAF6564498.1 hypothetical protein G9G63_10160 [Paenibacillus sp. EKM202P]KAF6571687.1 hypothetical protein G9G64_06615 [Paenibacillus sp. EKM207P]
MDKAILTKAQAESIESKIKNFSRERVIRDFVTATKENGSMDGITLDMLNRALYIGYEVQLTMEERMLAHFKEPKGYLAEYDTENVIYRKGMAKALEIAGIKVPGIND